MLSLSKNQFQAVFTSGNIVNTTHFRFAFGPGSGRVSIATTKKIGCHARRNFVKRRVKELVRASSFSALRTTDLIILAKKSVVTLGFDQFRSAFCQSQETVIGRLQQELGSF